MSAMQKFHQQLLSGESKKNTYLSALQRLTRANPEEVRVVKIESTWDIW
ncbi:MAG: hypothetical protein AB1894_11350 [Chloroflexota bacterium]